MPGHSWILSKLAGQWGIDKVFHQILNSGSESCAGQMRVTVRPSSFAVSLHIFSSSNVERLLSCFYHDWVLILRQLVLVMVG